MAKEYVEKLTRILSDVKIEDDISASIDVKHFFNGAALYVNGTIRVSLSPAGLAFKLSETDVARLLDSGQAKPLKYFEKGHIKKGYALFENPDFNHVSLWKAYFKKAMQLT